MHKIIGVCQIEREVESFSGVRHSVFKNEERPPGLGLDLAARDPTDVFKVI